MADHHYNIRDISYAQAPFLCDDLQDFLDDIHSRLTALENAINSVKNGSIQIKMHNATATLEQRFDYCQPTRNKYNVGSPFCPD